MRLNLGKNNIDISENDAEYFKFEPKKN